MFGLQSGQRCASGTSRVPGASWLSISVGAVALRAAGGRSGERSTLPLPEQVLQTTLPLRPHDRHPTRSSPALVSPNPSQIGQSILPDPLQIGHRPVATLLAIT